MASTSGAGSSRPPRNAALNAAKVSASFAEAHDRDESYDEEDQQQDESRLRQGSAISSSRGGEGASTEDGRIDGGDDDDLDEEEEDDADADGEGEGDADDQERQGRGRSADDLERLKGAVARHRQVAALAGGAYPTEGSKPMRKAPSGRTSKAIYKRFSDARIQAIENVISPDPKDTGWLPPPASSQDAAAIYDFVLSTIRNHTLSTGRRCIQSLHPSFLERPGFLDNAEKPTLLEDVEGRVARGEYADSMAFETDVAHVFTTFRRGHPIGSMEHGDVCILQRLYQRMTRCLPTSLTSSIPYLQNNLNTRDATYFYSTVHFGPGQAQRGQQGTDLTTRPIIKGKIYYTHAYHKGLVLKVGDWVHLMNPGDPTKPTLAQIFKISKREEDQTGPPLLSCCWYFRPEQTVHPPSRTFAAEEVFKTGLFADHVIDDVLEQTHVLFLTKWVRGRPPPTLWNPKTPIYFCEARYNERNFEFNVIKNWNSCLPEELRGAEQPLVYFSEAASQPVRLASPFLRGIPGPGRLCDESEVGRNGGDGGGEAIGTPEQPSKKRKVEEGAAAAGPSSMTPSAFRAPGSLPPAQQQQQQMRAPYPQQQPQQYPGGPPAPSPSSRMAPPSQQPHPSGYPPETLANAQRVYNSVCHMLHQALGPREVERTVNLFFAPPPAAAMNVDVAALSVSLRGVADVGTLLRLRDACLVLARAAAATRPPPQGGPGGAPGGGGAGRPQAGPQGGQRQSSGLPPKAGGGSSSSKGGPPHPPGPPGMAPPGPSQPPPPPAPSVEHTLEAAVGQIDAYYSPLPSETVEKFGDVPRSTRRRRGPALDEYEEMGGQVQRRKVVQWYAGAPVDIVGKKGGGRARHSLEYVVHRAGEGKEGEKREQGGVSRGESEAEAAAEAEAAMRELAEAWADVVAEQGKDGSGAGWHVGGEEVDEDEDDPELKAEFEALAAELRAAAS